MRSSTRRLAVLMFVFAATSARAQSQSSSYRLEPTTIDAAGAPGVSATRRANGSLAQALVVGTSSAPHFVVQSGFWGFSGSGLVPVELSASKVPAQPGDVALTWSGNNNPYSVYRAASCGSIFASVFTSTSNNFYTDSPAPPSGLTCYNVLAFAPGPVPPPSGSAAP
jgi:hypothetical protein